MNIDPDACEDPVTVPTAPALGRVEFLLWVFLLSFAFDYRAAEARADSGGAGVDQLLFLAACAFSTAGILLHGWRHLLVRPGAWLLIAWGSFLAFMLVNSFAQGVPPGRSLRIILPLFLCFAAMVNTHIAACMGLSASRIVAPVWTAACINILWRIAHGFLFKEVTLETVRVEVQSSANNWLAAWTGCALLLRKRFTLSLLAACAVLFTGVFITVTRSLLFPVVASALACSACFLLGIRWGYFRWPHLPSRLLPVTAALVLAAAGVGSTAVFQPALLERWNERLFHHASDRNVTEDVSWLTRRAEAGAIWKILREEPLHFVHGRGIGASYYWDPAYMPEIHLVYPRELELGHNVWFAGHSVWTYALFSGGVIALAAYLGLIGSTMLASLRAAAANAGTPGPDQWLVFLPFVAACCLLSESITSNPFDERLAALVFGIMVSLPQAFFVRASWIHASRAGDPFSQSTP